MGREICPISLLMQKGMCNMSTKKNFLARAQALLLAAVLTLSLLPVSAFAAENDLPQEVTPSVGQNAEVEYIGEELNVSTSSEDSAETGATDSLPSSAYSKQEDAAPTTETLALMEAQSIEETPPSPLEFSFYDVSTTKTTSLELRQAEDGTYTLYIPVSGVVDRNHCIKIIAPESYTEIFSLKYDSYVPGAYKIAPSPWEAKSEEGILTAEAYSVGSAPSLGDTELMFSRSMQLYVDGATYDISVQPYCDLETVGVEESKPLPTYRSNIARPYKEIELFKYYATAVTGKEITVKPNVNSNVSALLDPKGHNGCALVDGVKTKAYTITEKTTVTIVTRGSEEWGVEGRTYTLLLDPIEKDYFPELTYNGKTLAKPNTMVSTNIGEKYSITVTASAPDADLQWRTLSGKIVSTTNTVEIDTSNPANGMQNKHIFEASVVVDGLKYTSTASFLVTVRGNSLKDPVITSQPVSATYETGNKASPLCVVAEGSAGGKLSYTWYKNTKCSTDGAESVENKSKNKNEYIPDTGAGGIYYYYCVVQDTYGTGKNKITSKKVTSDIVRVEVTGGMPEGVTGSGTEKDPYILSTGAQLAALQNLVANGDGKPFRNTYFKFANDIELPQDWEPLGSLKEGAALPDRGVNINAFSGIIDGDGHKIIIPKGGLPLIGYARDAVVKNLNIYGEEINGYGLLNNYVVDYGDNGDYNVGDVPETIRIENCRLLKGSSTLKSGFIGGYASGKNYVYIIDCTIEEGVTIGYTGAESGIGSFGGEFNGMLINCTSSATVKGKNRVGGLVGNKGQSMGLFQIQNCSFTGAVIATGNYVGGILGSGYNAWSAPNSPLATVRNCFVSGSITGADKIGGITGGEPGVVQAWGNGAGDVVDNVFYGTITATGERKFVGGIIGYMQSLNKYNWVSDNYYCEDSGAAKGIGEIAIVDTSAEHETDSNTRYVNTAIEVPDIFGFDQRGGYNRTDDPVGKDADKLVKRVTKEDLTNETVVALLNSSKTSFRNWIQGATGPILRQEAVAYELVVGGEIKNQHYVGDALNLSGLTLTAKWSDGTTTNVPLNDSDLKITGYDSNKHGQQTVTLQYGAAKVEIVVTVLYKEPEDITVTITLLGDKAHGDNGQVHGLSKGGLTAWVSGHKVEVTTNMTVWDALRQLPGVTWDNPTGNYIKSVTYGGVTIGEFTNGKNSGWMYTLNGEYPMLGVSEQYLKKGDVIVFHYTDDYTLEAADMGPAPEEKKTADEVIALINAIGVVDLTKGDVIAKARAAYDALSAADKKLVTNYQTLLDAEAAYAKLVAELGKKADTIYKNTGDYLAKRGTPNVGSIGGEWMALGLARSGRTVPEGYYDTVVKYVKDNIDSNGRLDENKATENARIILALTAIGKDVTNVDGHDLLAGLNEMSYLSKQGINGAIFTLIALDSHSYTPAGDVTRDKLVQVILDAQISSDGGWSLDGKNADVDMTAMAIQALAAYYKSNSSAKKAVDKGLNWLSSVQQNDGGFTSWGAANSESCAQVIVALTALGIDPAKDSRFIKNGVSVLDALCSFAVDGGGFKHLATETSANGMATEQGFYALVAYYRLLNGQTRLYDMTDVKLEGVKAEDPVNDTDKPDDAADTDTPVDTEVGEASSGGQVVLWVVIGVVAVGGIAALAVTSKKRHGRDAE